MHVITPSTELTDLEGSESWILLKVAEVPEAEVGIWIQDGSSQSFENFQQFLKSICCVNNCAELNIRLIQDFIRGIYLRGHEAKSHAGGQGQ